MIKNQKSAQWGQNLSGSVNPAD